jgi:LuxR family transcriptional regulator, maltose regulon positive regulatory protein
MRRGGGRDRATVVNLPQPASGPPLLPTKLVVPAPRARAVHRGRLLERLAGAGRVPLTLVVAPAGFGKTTLLAQWAAALRPGRPGWVSLDAGDRDPARFWAYLVAALEGAWPGLATDAPVAARSPRALPETVPARLIVDLARLDRDVVLVLDDYHLAAEPAIDAGLTFLVEHAPPRLHLVLGTRTDPALPLARLRAQGQLLELRADELRCTAEEAARFCRETMGLELAPATVRALEARTEGWWAGLQLAALGLRDRPDPERFVEAFAGSHRYVLDYLLDQVLARQPPPRQAFLLRTAILERLSGALCDAVTGRHDGQAQLEGLERDNLFLVPLDDERGWYRYHHLFRDVLRHHLRLTTPELVPELHRRANAWCAAHGLRQEAIEHALEAEDWERAAGLLEGWMEPLRLHGEYVTLHRWLARLPEPVRAGHPLLSYQYALALVRRARADEAEQATRALDAVERGAAAGGDPGLLGAVARARLSLAIQRGAIDEAIAWGERAAAAISPAAWQLRVEALVTLGRAWVLRGRPAAAEPALDEAQRLLRTNADPELLCLALNADGHRELARGRLRRAADRLHEARRLGALAGSPRDLGVAWGALAGSPRDLGVAWGALAAQPSLEHAHAALRLSEVEREWDHLDEAEALLDEAGQVGARSAQAAYQFPLANALTRVRLARGDLAGALAAVEQAMPTARAWGNAMVLRGLAADRARIQLAQGDTAAVRQWADDVEPDVAALQSLADDRVAEMLARARIAGGAPDRARALLAERRAAATAADRHGHLIAVEALDALALDALGDRPGALDRLGRALELAEAEGYVRTFVDEGPPMLALLREALGRRLRPAYVARLVAAFGGPSAAPAGGVLTEREREVLRLLAGGCSNRDIARRLVITEHTAKVHVARILHKLGVGSRTQALARARELGLA